MCKYEPGQDIWQGHLHTRPADSNQPKDWALDVKVGQATYINPERENTATSHSSYILRYVANVRTSVCEVCGVLHGVTTKPPSCPPQAETSPVGSVLWCQLFAGSFRQGSLSIRRRDLLVRGAATKRLTRERELPLHEWSRQHNTKAEANCILLGTLV